jgi:hypothetical protein
LPKVKSDYLPKIIDVLETKELWNKNIPDMIVNYFFDMQIILKKSYLALKNGGFCTIVVGNSTYGGVVIPTDLLISEIAKSIGFNVDCIDVDRFIITSSQQYNSTQDMSDFQRESVICLKKK